MVIGTPTVLNLIPGGVKKVIHVNQVNENIEIQFRIMNGTQPFNVPEGVSCTIRGTKGDSFGYAADVAVTAGSNIVTVTLTEQLTAVAGAGNVFELVFVGASDDMKVSTENFILAVERAALGEDTVISDSDLEYANQVLDQLQSVGAVNAQVQQNKANIAAEITRATAAEQTLQQNINAEAAARAAAVSAEAAARQSADNTLQSNISAEASTRVAADASLQSQIDQIIAPSGEAPSAAEVENARVGADGVTYPTLGDAIRTNDSLLKSQIDAIGNIEPIKFSGWVQGNAYNNNGTITTSSSTTRCRLLPTNKNTAIRHIIAKTGYKFVWAACTLSSNVYTVIAYNSNWSTYADVSAYSDAYYIVVTCAKTDDTSDITPFEASANIGYSYDLYDTVNNNKKLFADVVQNIKDQITWVNGSFLGSIVQANAKRLITSMPLELCDCIAPSGTALRAVIYDEHYAVLGQYNPFTEIYRADIIEQYPTAKYMRVEFRLDSNEDLSPSDISNYAVEINQNRYILPVEKTRELVDILYYGTVQQGGFNVNGTDDSGNALRVRTPFYIPVSPGEKYTVEIKLTDGITKTPQISVSFYAVADFSTARISFTNFVNFVSGKSEITVPTGAYYMRMLFGFSGNSSITPDNIEYIKITHGELALSKDGYVIGADLLKKSIHCALLGTLAQAQSFCVYDGYYYSTDGSTITKQNSGFETVTSASLSVGHGNAFQLGTNGKAYVSGWDDDKVYVVDLETLTIDRTITLPVTGYTTCAVDDEKGMMYIFRRSTNPVTAAQYDFIVYDYINDNVITTVKTRPFAAMQACDFYKDRIIVLNGGGTSQIPNGYTVYDVSGNVIADFTIPMLSTVEPEGVCVNRDTGELLISYYNKNVYAIQFA